MVADWSKVGAIAGIAGLGITIFGGLLGVAWKTLQVFQGMRTSLHTIATNDLPHIYAELQDMRRDFLDYIKEERNRG